MGKLRLRKRRGQDGASAPAANSKLLVLWTLLLLKMLLVLRLQLEVFGDCLRFADCWEQPCGCCSIWRLNVRLRVCGDKILVARGWLEHGQAGAGLLPAPVHPSKGPFGSRAHGSIRYAITNLGM